MGEYSWCVCWVMWEGMAAVNLDLDLHSRQFSLKYLFTYRVRWGILLKSLITLK